MAFQRVSNGIALLIASGRWVINPGSVGQPHDGDPRAAFAIYDGRGGIVEVAQVSYDVAATQQHIQDQGFPEPLIARLDRGQ